jgi:general stress protein 26
MHEALTLDDLRERVDGVRVAMVTTPEADGALSSRPLTIQRITEEGDIIFLIGRDAGWVAEQQQVDVAIVDEGRTWVSVSGTAEYIDERSAVDDHWDTISSQFFDDPSEAMIMRVAAQAWSYWAAPNRLAQTVELVRAIATDHEPDLGDSGVIAT